MWFVTDPVRTPDPVAVAERLPSGTGVIFRHFGRPDARIVAHRLAAVARRRRLVLLIGADEILAAEVGAAGVHLPERSASHLPRLKARRPGWIVTLAAHSPRAARNPWADAILLSTVFESGSASAGRPIGPVRLGLLIRGARTPVYALGGVNARTAGRLVGTGAAGLAAVEAFRT